MEIDGFYGISLAKNKYSKHFKILKSLIQPQF